MVKETSRSKKSSITSDKIDKETLAEITDQIRGEMEDKLLEVKKDLLDNIEKSKGEVEDVALQHIKDRQE